MYFIRGVFPYLDLAVTVDSHLPTACRTRILLDLRSSQAGLFRVE